MKPFARRKRRAFLLSQKIFHQPFGVAPEGFFFLSVDQARRKRISLSRGRTYARTVFPARRKRLPHGANHFCALRWAMEQGMAKCFAPCKLEVGRVGRARRVGRWFPEICLRTLRCAIFLKFARRALRCAIFLKFAWRALRQAILLEMIKAAFKVHIAYFVLSNSP